MADKQENGTGEEFENAEIISVEQDVPQRSGGGRGALVVALLALLVAIGAAAGAGWMWYQSQQREVAVGNRDAAVGDRIDALSGRLGQLASVQAQAGDAVDAARRAQDSAQQVESALGQLRSEISSVAAELASLKGLKQEDWVLAEAEYLLRLASQSVLMGRETRGAQAMLRAADDILREQDNPHWYSVRQAIAADVAALEAAGRLDLEGIYLRIGALIPRTAILQLDERDMRGGELIGGSAEAAEDPTWLRRLMAIFDRYVLVRRRSEPVEPLLPIGEEHLLRMNLRLMLEQAQAALLTGEPVIYRDSLVRAQGLVTGYFEPSIAVNTAFQRELQALAQVDVNPELPDISGSLLEMRAVMNAIPTLESAPAQGVNAP